MIKIYEPSKNIIWSNIPEYTHKLIDLTSIHFQFPETIKNNALFDIIRNQRLHEILNSIRCNTESYMYTNGYIVRFVTYKTGNQERCTYNIIENNDIADCFYFDRKECNDTLFPYMKKNIIYGVDRFNNLVAKTIEKDTVIKYLYRELKPDKSRSFRALHEEISQSDLSKYTTAIGWRLI